MKLTLLKSVFILSSFLYVSYSFSQEDNFKIPDVPDGVVKKFSGNDMTPYENTSKFQQKYRNEQERRSQLEQELKSLKSKLAQDNQTPQAQNNSASVSNDNLDSIQSSNVKNGNVIQRKIKIKQHSVYRNPLVFTVSENKINSINTTVLPLGSYVKTRVLTGVEANADEAYPMLLQADYAFIGPNSSKIDMSGCFFISKTKGNLSTERVNGEITDMSCVRSNGEHFKRKVHGYIAGEDSTFGITGELMSKQGQVLAAAIIANLAKGAGDAIALAQQTQTIGVGNTGSAATATNITGSTGAFVAGRAVADASTTIANWYLNYATKLVPSIAIGSGRDVWIVMLDDTDVPSLDESDSQS